MDQYKNIYYACGKEDDTVYDIYQLFQYYNIHFFQNKLESCTVRWTNRMTLCAGTCKYEGYGSSTISLSQPLLKFRSADEVKQTLIHEMIHAYLFKINPNACKFNGGHGPEFVSIMEKINRKTGLNISVYHSFHDQVDFYKQHVWRCNGRCRDQPPFYGYVKRSMNRAPQPADYWFASHKRTCGGEYTKISQPQNLKNKQKKEKTRVKKSKRLSEEDRSSTFSKGKGKTLQDYIDQMNNQQKNNEQKNKGKQKSCAPQQVIKITYPNKQNRKQDSAQDNKTGIILSTKRIKTIQQYFKEIQQEKKKSIVSAQKQNIQRLLEKYETKQND